MPVSEPEGNLSRPTSSRGSSPLKSIRQGKSVEYTMASICGASLRESIACRIGCRTSVRNAPIVTASRLPCHGSMSTLIGGMPRSAA
ncbi:MAG: hypothetical protein EBS56_00905 [Planctomycetia bacterium]|nr:hypothetical protein [Planctomycetia bacterium]